jgi:hypothetical protein
MRKIEIRGSEKTPKIIFDPQGGCIKILGRSTMTNPHEFYPTITKVLKDYCIDPAEKTHLFMDLEYYNTLSSRYILNILKLISRINSLEGKEAKIFWYFDEEDYGIRDDIKMFSELIDHKIHEIEYELA